MRRSAAQLQPLGGRQHVADACPASPRSVPAHSRLSFYRRLPRACNRRGSMSRISVPETSNVLDAATCVQKARQGRSVGGATPTKSDLTRLRQPLPLPSSTLHRYCPRRALLGFLPYRSPSLSRRLAPRRHFTRSLPPAGPSTPSISPTCRSLGGFGRCSGIFPLRSNSC
jgi:hypothetical protein